MSNAFTPPGQSRYEGSLDDISQLRQNYLKLQGGALPMILAYLKAQGGNQAGLKSADDQYNSAVMGTMRNASALSNTNNFGSYAARAGNEAFDQATANNRDVMATNPGAGIGRALLLDALNKRATAAGATRDKLNDPLNRLQINSTAQGQIAQAGQNYGQGPQWQQLQHILSIFGAGNAAGNLGTPQAPQGGLGSVLGGAFGSWAGGGFKTH